MKTETTWTLDDRSPFGRFRGSNPGRWLACRLRLAWRRYRHWSAARRAIRHLRELDQYLLDDVGIERSEISEVAHGGKGPRQNPNQRIGPQPAEAPSAKLAA